MNPDFPLQRGLHPLTPLPSTPLHLTEGLSDPQIHWTWIRPFAFVHTGLSGWKAPAPAPQLQTNSNLLKPRLKFHLSEARA